MESKSSRGLTIKPIREVIDEAKDYIGKRKRGEERSLRVSSTKVNNAFMGGFDWGRIITLAGTPGSGKSTLLRQ
jgi:predicted ATP-dependent serine protease